MTKPAGILFSVFLLCASVPSVRGNDAPSASAVPAANRAPAMKASPAPADPKQRFKPPAPLKRLIFSARQGFSLRMISSQEVTAEIRNGAGRTLARGAYTLEAGDWTLRPRNLAPGLYTVLLRTGPQLRALRMKIDDAERGKGSPEWVLEKAVDSSAVNEQPSSSRGASVFPAPD